jgi:rRNA-processing protein FCF1
VRKHLLKQLAAAAEAAEAAHSPPAVTSNEPVTAPVLLVLDTNCLMQFLAQSKRIAEDVLHYRADTSLLVPREVYRELDRKKVSSTCVTPIHIILSLLLMLHNSMVVSFGSSWDVDLDRCAQ